MSISARTRFEILKRDGFRCVYCGARAADGTTLHVDHVVPRARGGGDRPENLITACDRCNLGKSDVPLDDTGRAEWLCELRVSTALGSILDAICGASLSIAHLHLLVALVSESSGGSVWIAIGEWESWVCRRPLAINRASAEARLADLLRAGIVRQYAKAEGDPHVVYLTLPADLTGSYVLLDDRAPSPDVDAMGTRARWATADALARLGPMTRSFPR